MKINNYLSTTDDNNLDRYCQHCVAWITDIDKHHTQNQHHTLIAGTEPPDWYKHNEEYPQ